MEVHWDCTAFTGILMALSGDFMGTASEFH